MEAFIRKLMKLGKKVYIITAMPCSEEFNPKSFFTRNFLGYWSANVKHVSKQSWSKNIHYIHYVHQKKILHKIAHNTGASVLDPEIFLCSKTAYLTHLQDNTPVYKDASHLSFSYVRKHVTFLDFLFEP